MLGKWQHLVLDLAANPQQLPGGDQQHQVGTRLDQLRELRRRVDDLLQVVQQQQQLPLADVRGQLSFAPSVCAIVSATSAGSRSEASPTQNTPALNSGTSSAAASIASRVFPVPPGPVSVTSRAPSANERDNLRHLALAADEARRRPRQVRVRDRLQRRKRTPPSWNSDTGSSKSFNRCSPRSSASASTSSRVAPESST